MVGFRALADILVLLSGRGTGLRSHAVYRVYSRQGAGLPFAWPDAVSDRTHSGPGATKYRVAQRAIPHWGAHHDRPIVNGRRRTLSRHLLPKESARSKDNA